VEDNIKLDKKTSRLSGCLLDASGSGTTEGSVEHDNVNERHQLQGQITT
jgi:hypothetical protein